ncbi:formyl transferase [Hugenholtzia roseola]|uniref:formyl transferase n=1 Tax=Hugenholtzia roseola TaxID=1002 RepID=UPI0004268220|nr:formyl transferase [Hugenholtzia roseola]
MDKKIIMLTEGGRFSTYLYNALKEDFSIAGVVVEDKISKKKLLKNRTKKLGYVKVLGQIFFQIFVQKTLEYTSKKRINLIELNYNLNKQAIPSQIIKKVESVNSNSCIAYLKAESPDIVIVNGTRIISKEVLNSIDALFLNIHTGITPQYRGVHGGYWAMVCQDAQNCGVTVHFVDSGIDTGKVLLQSRINPTSKDNFATYPYLQIGEGIILMKQAISNLLKDEIQTQDRSSQEKGNLWYHPTIWFYLYKRLTKRIK